MILNSLLLRDLGCARWHLVWHRQLDWGFKLTRHSLYRSVPSWQAVAANKHPSAVNFMSKQQSLGMQLAQLGRDASAAGATRRFKVAQKKNVEVESVAAAGKLDVEATVMYLSRGI